MEKRSFYWAFIKWFAPSRFERSLSYFVAVYPPERMTDFDPSAHYSNFPIVFHYALDHAHPVRLTPDFLLPSRRMD